MKTDDLLAALTKRSYDLPASRQQIAVTSADPD